ncbi:MAG: restriction endonuclease [Candidatus Methylomirabilis oxygeniifera]|uniref:Type-2 restriction enzyme MunI (R.MunI) (Type II restriction enzyme MunI) (Endonuclease MunI) n=1 Tax=Methylomirabilis oxygeniifera TaxID=671143 RepID=D5MM18_METO1|nr:MAG: restriction endonuclease [Candidatus Methylomirabilis oxyfera]CBE67904.1 Type-2 restriction enzyme MunI (R.MunI) (Type II restriction enzyme MunI) (Endonuclease MunI) [Candidatus Methylomirabilis oxyfera]
MGSKELKGRAVWQDQSGANAKVAEKDFYAVFETAFQNTSFRIRSKPKEFKNIYTNVILDPSVSAEIYNPKEGIKRHGISPDYAIDNLDTKKTLYVEVKRQDGWVEGGKRSDGRGNAHERSCKFFTPGLLEVMRHQGRLGDKVLPFWTVFLGDITRDPCRVREITLWYKGYEDHFFFWRNPKDEKSLLKHFQEKLKHLLI